MGSLWEPYGKGVPFLGAPGNSLDRMRVANKGLHTGIPFPTMMVILMVTVAGKGNNPTYRYFEIFLNFSRTNMPTKNRESPPQQTYTHTLANMNTTTKKHKFDLL